MTTTSRAARQHASQLTAGVPGDELIRRRQEGFCIACGFTKVHARSMSSDQPWLCDRCAKLVPPKPKFDAKQHKAEGIRNLERLEAGVALRGSERPGSGRMRPTITSRGITFVRPRLDEKHEQAQICEAIAALGGKVFVWHPTTTGLRDLRRAGRHGGPTNGRNCGSAA